MSGNRWKKAILFWEKNNQSKLPSQRLSITKSLFESAENGDTEKIKDILDKAVININTKLGSETILHVAAFNGHANLVDFLCKNGAQINKRDHDNLSPLCISVLKNHLEVVKVLLNHGADPEGSFRISLDLQSKSISSILVQYGTLFDTCISTCSDSSLLDQFSNIFLSSPNIDLNARTAGTICLYHWEKGLTPLHLAVDRGKESLVQKLIGFGANVNAKSETKLTPLDLAVRNDHLRIVECLLNNGAEVRHSSAVDTGLLFVSEKASFVRNDPRSQEDFTVLVRITEILLKNRVAVNCHDCKGFTPLHYAACVNEFRPEIVRLLLDHGADVNAVNKNHATPIFYTKNELILELLIERGANINYVSTTLFTPLSHMFNCDRLSCVDLLLKRGADVSIQNSEGKTILDIYEPRYFYENLEILENLVNSVSDLNFVIRYLGKSNLPPKLIDTLAALVVKRKVAKGISIDMEMLEPDYPFGIYRYFRSRVPICETEIQRMKARKIHLQDFTCFDILDMPISKLLNYVEREELQKLVSDNIEGDFPIYAEMFKRHVEKARHRRSLIGLNAEAFKRLIHQLHKLKLPDLVVYQIIPMLSNKHLINLAQVLSVCDKDGFIR
ncbi:poly [ADP-ribose] polymerase tankyrase-1-like [Belonocnema kinseyi]|uniref:poly [ADP-ribose] polymerase tankyrase-1-like n=1 Tax=Belonocnema kinseyi TaxID=2817044 RepID=UPI00143DDE0B|nr:poly [ADP-ribose] polymerase tankyrase-1-like [Belonocnema kinseyi]